MEDNRTKFHYDIPLDQLGDFIVLVYEMNSYQEAMKWSYGEQVEEYRQKWVDAQMKHAIALDIYRKKYANDDDYKDKSVVAQYVNWTDNEIIIIAEDIEIDARGRVDGVNVEAGCG